MADNATAVADATEEKLEQAVKVEDSGPARKTITIEVPESRIKAKIEEMYGTLRSDAVLPGFRKGRAPRRLLEKRFAETIQGDLKNQLISESYGQAIEENELDVIGNPEVKDIEELKVPEAGPLTLVIEVEISPKVDLPDFKKIKVTKPSAEVTDADLEEEIESLRERFGKMDSVEDAKIKEGDYVQCDTRILAGEDAGDDAEELARHPEAYTLVHGKKDDFKGHIAGILVDDLGKRLKGKTLGDEVRISMTGPKGHEDEKIKDQPITLVLSVKRVDRLAPAEVSALVEQMGVENEDEFKTRIREMLQQRAESKQTAEMHKQIADQLLEKVELELPEGLKGRQIERVLQRQRMELLYSGATPEQVEEKLAEARNDSEADAIQQLKAFFIIDQAAKDLDVEVDQNEINGRIAMMAMQQGRRPEKMRQEMTQRGEIEQLYLSIRETKTLDKILESADVTDAK